MLRIALCITDLNVGGAERCLVELATRIDRNRFIPVVYCLSLAPLAGETTLIPALQAAGMEVECPWGPQGDGFSEGRGPSGRTGSTSGKRKSCSRCCSTPTSSAGSRPGGPACRTWYVEFASPSGDHPGICGSIAMTHRMVDRYVCVSQSVADFSASTARLPADKLVVIPNGIDLGPVHQRAAGRSGKLRGNRPKARHVHRAAGGAKGPSASPGHRGQLAAAAARLRPADCRRGPVGSRFEADNATTRELPYASTLPAGGRMSRQSWLLAACWC